MIASSSRFGAATAGVLAFAIKGSVLTVSGYNPAGLACFFQLHDSAAAPADQAIPKWSVSVPADSNWSFDVPGGVGIQLTAGCQIVQSSTAATYTAVGGPTTFTAQVVYLPTV